MQTYLLLYPAALGLISRIHKKFQRNKFVNLAEVNQLCCVEDIEQWLKNVDQTHLVLAGGKASNKKKNQHGTR